MPAEADKRTFVMNGASRLRLVWDVVLPTLNM